MGTVIVRKNNMKIIRKIKPVDRWGNISVWWITVVAYVLGVLTLWMLI